MIAQVGGREPLGCPQRCFDCPRIRVELFSWRLLPVVRWKSVSEAVAPKPWEDMQVHVEHFLPGRLAIRQEQVDALRLQTRSPNSCCESLCRSE